MKLAVLTAAVLAAAALTVPANAVAAGKPIVEGSGSSLPGASTVPGGYKTWAELFAVQEKLDAAATKVTNLKAAGLAGIAVSAETKTVKVYWKGTAPAAVRAAGASLGTGLGLKVLPARYSQAELVAAANRAARTGGVASAAPAVDGSGIAVSLKPGAATAARSSLTSAAAVPVTFEAAAAPSVATRGDDYAPYWGGARWNGCSSGFAIRIAGVAKMLSAGHCAANGNTAYDGGGQVMGTVSGDNNAYDRLYINANSSGRVYDGGVGVNEFSKPVAYAQWSYVGDWICSSGAYSGARCGIQVKATNVTINAGYLIYQTVRAEQTSYQNAVGNGDSGGPSFALSSDPNRVIAKGTHTAIDGANQVPCTGVPTGGGRICSWRMYYVDVQASLNAYGATIITG